VVSVYLSKARSEKDREVTIHQIRIWQTENF
jgi:hypothetical protein